LSRQCFGTPGYLALEVFKQKHCNELVDVFSLGAVMHVCIYGRRLFSGRSPVEILKSNSEGNINLNLFASEYLNTAGLDFLKKLRSKEPSNGPSAKDALWHMWLKEEDDVCAATAGVASKTLQQDSCEDVTCSDSHHDSDFDGLSEHPHDSVCRRTPKNEFKNNKRSWIPSFRGFLQWPRPRQAMSLNNVFTATTTADDSDVKNPAATSRSSQSDNETHERL